MNDLDHDELLYERWVINDGPRKANRKHRKLAFASLKNARRKRWKILQIAKYRDYEVRLIEVVVRSDNGKGDVYHLRWNLFNQGWMCRANHGWIIFNKF